MPALVPHKSLWSRLVLLGTPLALAVLEVFHPDAGDAAEAIDQADWFFWFHMIQLPLVGLMALALHLLTEDLEGTAVTVSRWGTGVFAIFFSAYDAAAGIATGFVLRNAQSISPEEQSVVYDMVKDMPGVSAIFSLSIVGTGAWVVALVSAALARRRAGAPRITFVFLILAGVFLLAGHPFPGGTLAFGSFFVATLSLELTARRPPPTPA